MTGRPRGASTARHHATSDLYFSDEEWEFLEAVSSFQKKSGKKFPTFAELLGVAKSLGYSRPNMDELHNNEAALALA